MKLRLILIMLAFTALAVAAPIYNLPATVEQPDGTVVNCFSSGDEFFNRLHDADGYTIIRSKTDGWLYYATWQNDKIVPSVYKVNTVNPGQVGLRANIKITEAQYLERRQRFQPDVRSDTRIPNTGNVNNVVIFIKFSDQTEFPETRNEFDLKFNDDSENAESVYDYYKEVTYNQLFITSHYYPVCDMNTNLSFVDTHPRSYYQEYNSTTNPNGYSNDNMATTRKVDLLYRAIQYVANQVPADLNIDADNDGRVDNVCFVIRGQSGGWADLLWAHRSRLASVNATIQGKRVWDYTFQPQNQVETSTLCHELFHVIGAPDLYHYSQDGANPVGPWDLMGSGFGHMNAYMKWYYGNWIDDIPWVDGSGFFELSPLAASSTNSAVRIASPNSDSEYFVLEYRKKIPGTYEMNCPSGGIVIYRVNTARAGQGNVEGPPEELYAYRVGGTIDNFGNANSATFSIETNRTEFSDTTNPSCFLSDGSAGGLHIAQVSSNQGDTIRFLLNPQSGLLVGNVSVDGIDDYDLTDIDVIIGSEVFQPDAGGLFTISHMQGFYDVQVTGPGLRGVTEELEIAGNDITSHDFDLEPLPVPYSLSYSIDNDIDITLIWQYDLATDPSFDHYNVYLSVNDGPFNVFRTPTEAQLALPFTVQLNISYKVSAVFTNGESYLSEARFVDYTPTNQDTAPAKPTALGYAVPNPFNPTTNISFNLDKPQQVKLSIYNLRGQQVKTLVNAKMDAGKHEVIWTGNDDLGNKVASGVYLYKMQSGRYTSTKKMILLK